MLLRSNEFTKIKTGITQINNYHIQGIIIRPVLLYACETWPTTKGDEDKLAILERRILRRIFGPKINNMTQQYEKRNNIEIQQLYKEPDIVAVLKRKI